MTTELCFITTCKGRLEHLKCSLPKSASQPHASCVVVDYSCPELAGQWVENLNLPNVTVVYAMGCEKFNLSHARNLGAQAANAPWICFLDADAYPEPDFMKAIQEALVSGCYYVPAPTYAGLGGLFICSKADFDRVGGCDEVIKGWGCEDDDFKGRLELMGVKRKTFPATLVGQIKHADNIRTQFYSDDKETAYVKNLIYMRSKLWIMRKFKICQISRSKREAMYRLASWFVKIAGHRRALKCNNLVTKIHAQICR